MNRLAIIASVFFCAGSCAAAQEALYQLSTAGTRVENGKHLDMHYQEITREAGSSVVEVTRNSGGSVSSSIFTLRASCGLMRARGEKFFRVVPLSKTPIRFRLEFPQEATPAQLRPPTPSDKVFTLEECAMIGG